MPEPYGRCPCRSRSRSRTAARTHCAARSVRRRRYCARLRAAAASSQPRTAVMRTRALGDAAHGDAIAGSRDRVAEDVEADADVADAGGRERGRFRSQRVAPDATGSDAADFTAAAASATSCSTSRRQPSSAVRPALRDEQRFECLRAQSRPSGRSSSFARAATASLERRERGLLAQRRRARNRFELEFVVVERPRSSSTKLRAQRAAQAAQALRARRRARSSLVRRVRREIERGRIVENPRPRRVGAARGRVAPAQHAPQQRLARQRPVGGAAKRGLRFRIGFAPARALDHARAILGEPCRVAARGDARGERRVQRRQMDRRHARHIRSAAATAAGAASPNASRLSEDRCRASRARASDNRGRRRGPANAAAICVSNSWPMPRGKRVASASRSSLALCMTTSRAGSASTVAERVELDRLGDRIDQRDAFAEHDLDQREPRIERADAHELGIEAECRRRVAASSSSKRVRCDRSSRPSAGPSGRDCDAGVRGRQ